MTYVRMTVHSQHPYTPYSPHPVRDEIDPEKDRDIASHVLQMHRYVRPGHENLPEAGGEEDEEEKVDNGEMYVKGSERKKKGACGCGE